MRGENILNTENTKIFVDLKLDLHWRKQLSWEALLQQQSHVMLLKSQIKKVTLWGKNKGQTTFQ